MNRATPALLGVAFLLGMTGSGLGATQDAKTPPPTKPPLPVILNRAIQAQKAKKLERPIRDFSVSLKVKIDDASTKAEFDIERRYKAPDKIWTSFKELAVTGKRYREGFDGDTGWYQDKEDFVLYTEPDYTEDLRKLASEIEVTQLLLKFFFLENLVGKLEGTKRLHDASQGAFTAYVIEGRAEVPLTEVGGMAKITLWIDQKSHNLLGVKIEPEGRPEEAVHFCFWSHQPNPQGVMFPQSIKVYRAGRSEAEQEIFLYGEDDGNGGVLNNIRFNTGLDDDLFLPPPPR